MEGVRSEGDGGKQMEREAAGSQVVGQAGGMGGKESGKLSMDKKQEHAQAAEKGEGRGAAV